MSTTPILAQRDIVHEPETGTYAMYLDGELVGFARTHGEGETTLDELVYQQLLSRPLSAAEALAHEMVSLHPSLSLTDALDIAREKIDAVLAYAAAYDAVVSAQVWAALAA
jgi:hypothetical protein